MEPPDFEEFLYQHQNAIDRDPMRHLLEFPPDDVRVEPLQRTVRTVSPVMPEQGYVRRVIPYLHTINAIINFHSQFDLRS